MKYRRFGRTELAMPVFSCGGMRFQFKWQDVDPNNIPRKNQQNLEATVHRAFELGINHFETARGCEPKKKAPGSLAVEVAMWFFFCLPGFIYTIWRNTCPLKLCAHCGSQAIIPTDSPNAQAMLEARAAKGLPALPVQTKKSRVPRSVWLILAAFIVLILILVLATRATPP